MSLQVVNTIFLCLSVFACAWPSPSCAKNVTQYHAAIDGAGQKLMEKTERLSLADRDLVQRADERAEEMDKQANELEEWDTLL